MTAIGDCIVDVLCVYSILTPSWSALKYLNIPVGAANWFRHEMKMNCLEVWQFKNVILDYNCVHCCTKIATF